MYDTKPLPFLPFKYFIINDLDMSEIPHNLVMLFVCNTSKYTVIAINFPISVNCNLVKCRIYQVFKSFHVPAKLKLTPHPP